MPGKKARWLEEPEVREGIRAVLKQQRCLEERRRLGIEADNLCRWFGEEICAVELALRCPECRSIQLSYHINFVIRYRYSLARITEAKKVTSIAAKDALDKPNGACSSL